MRRRNKAPIACLLPTVFLCCLWSVHTGCRTEPPADDHRKTIVIGVDGAEWKVIHWLWEQGRLPHLRAFADRGVSGPLETFHHASPVIWTTMATGVMPQEHGITEFVIPTAKGDQPPSSGLRRVPALWNMATATGKRVAVAGWWATWPAEAVNGIMVSDRAGHDIEDRVSPPEALPWFEEMSREDPTARKTIYAFDRVVGRCAEAFVRDDYDLVLAYFRGGDLASHFFWRYFEPSGFPEVKPGLLEMRREKIAAEYEFVDDTVSAIMAAGGEACNVILVSDHGFRAMDHEEVRIQLSLDPVLEHFGFLARSSEGIDFGKTQVYSYDSPDRELIKKIRFSSAGREAGGRVGPADRAGIRTRLEAALETVTYSNGKPALRVRDADAAERTRGADLVVEVLPDGANPPLVAAGQTIEGALRPVSRLSGTHGASTPGVFIAAGPDIAATGWVEGCRVIDIPPTVLYSIGLPVADNFAGRVLTELFDESFLTGRPIQTIPTWGESTESAGRSSEVDSDIVEQLRSLGYLD